MSQKKEYQVTLHLSEYAKNLLAELVRDALNDSNYSARRAFQQIIDVLDNAKSREGQLAASAADDPASLKRGDVELSAPTRPGAPAPADPSQNPRSVTRAAIRDAIRNSFR
jgi:hypothetical protein